MDNRMQLVKLVEFGRLQVYNFVCNVDYGELEKFIVDNVLGMRRNEGTYDEHPCTHRYSMGSNNSLTNICKIPNIIRQNKIPCIIILYIRV